jgi:hypothetical protein
MQSTRPQNKFANHEIVTIVVYLLGGESLPVDTEDVAVRANEIAPGRFLWRKYPHQINIENVRSLSMKMRQSVSEFSVERCVFMIDSPCAPESCAVG